MLRDWLHRLLAGLDFRNWFGRGEATAGTESMPSVDAVRVIGCSVGGEKGERNDDAWSKRTVGDSAFAVAVADGLGSEPYAHEGSRVAADAAVEALAEPLADAERVTAERTADSMEAAFAHARRQLRRRADERGVPLGAFGTTLLVAAGDPTGTVGAAVGDGGVVAAAGDEYFTLVERESGEYANVTTPLTGDRWRESYRFGASDEATAVALFTDGLSNFVWAQGNSAEPSDAFFEQVLPPIYRADRPETVESELCAFLEDPRFREISRDDKTLAVALVPGADSREAVADRKPTTIQDSTR